MGKKSIVTEDENGRISQNLTTYALTQTGNSDMMALFQSKGIANHLMMRVLVPAGVSVLLFPLASSLRRRSEAAAPNVDSIACPVLAALIKKSIVTEDENGRISQNSTHGSRGQVSSPTTLVMDTSGGP